MFIAIDDTIFFRIESKYTQWVSDSNFSPPYYYVENFMRFKYELTLLAFCPDVYNCMKLLL